MGQGAFCPISVFSTLHLVPVLNDFDKRYMHARRGMFSPLGLEVAECLPGITNQHTALLTHYLGNTPSTYFLPTLYKYLVPKLRDDHDIAVQFSAAYF